VYYTGMTELIKLYKNIGETPLECIERFRIENPKYLETKMTYLGRLDPMAEGLLLVLAGNTKEKEKYLDLDKAYEFEVLWGFETDTYDILGLVLEMGKTPIKLEERMERLLREIGEKKTQTYPQYSSRTVFGKALHSWSREGRIDEIEIPTRSVKIFSIEHLNTRLINGEELLENILGRIDKVLGDFRQGEIKKKWIQELEIMKREKFLISSFKASVSSGTYIRSLSHEMGKILGTKALAFNIKRTRVGEYKI